MSFVPPTSTPDERLLNALLLEKTRKEAELRGVEQELNEFTFRYGMLFGYINLYETILSSQGYDIATGVQDATVLWDPVIVDAAVVRLSDTKSLGQFLLQTAGTDRWRSLDLKVAILDLDEQIIPIESKVLTIKQHRQEINNLVEALASALGKLSIKDSTRLSEPLQEVVIVERLFRRLFDPRIEAVTRQFRRLMI